MVAALLTVMLHGTIRNDDFQRNKALQCWNNVVTIRNNVATMLQRCVALKSSRVTSPLENQNCITANTKNYVVKGGVTGRATQ